VSIPSWVQNDDVLSPAVDEDSAALGRELEEANVEKDLVEGRPESAGVTAGAI
jgi:hypothetical protein